MFYFILFLLGFFLCYSCACAAKRSDDFILESEGMD